MARRKGPPAGRFELGGYWIDRHERSPRLYVHWYDPRTGRVRRRSLGTEDLEEAKRHLASHVLTKGNAGGQPDELPGPRRVLIVAVLDHYLEHRAKHLPSREAAERACQLLSQWLFEAKRLPAATKADAFGLAEQEEFVRWSAATFGHSAKYISRNLSVIAAAMHFAAEEQAVDDDIEGRRIVRLMSQAPRIRYDPNWIAKVARIAAPQKRDWVPELEEMASFIDCIRSENCFRFVVIALNTWARAEAILELDLKRQVRRTGLLDLNPPGRVQNPKRRPIIRLTENLKAWIEEWPPRPLTEGGEAIASIKKAMQAASALWMMQQADIEQKRIERLMARGNHIERTRLVQELEAQGYHRISPRVIRSFMATTVTNFDEFEVPEQQIKTWLGHEQQTTTRQYQLTNKNYLRRAAEATDLVIGRIDAISARSLWPAGGEKVGSGSASVSE